MAVPICAQRGHVRTSAPTGAGSPGCCGALSEGCCRACWEGRRGMPGLAPRLARPRLRPALPRRARVGAGPDSEALMATDSNQNFIHHSHYLFNAAAFVTNRTLMLPSLLFPCTAFRAGAGPWCLRLRRHPVPVFSSAWVAFVTLASRLIVQVRLRASALIGAMRAAAARLRSAPLPMEKPEEIAPFRPLRLDQFEALWSKRCGQSPVA